MIPKLDIIIVNWNAGNLLRECLESIPTALNNDFELTRVVIVDNASTDDSLHGIENTKLELFVIKNESNLGFAKACNQGAANTDADFLLFLNPDTLLFPDSLSKPINFLLYSENKNIGIVGVKIEDQNKNISKNCARFPTRCSLVYRSFGLDALFPKIFKSHFMTEWDHVENRFVDQVMGSFFFVKREVFDLLKGYDESYFVYYEDLDFSIRAKKNGFLSYYLADSKIFHFGGGTTVNIKAERLFYLLRSKLIYCKKHFDLLSYIIIALMILAIEPVTRILGALIKGSKKDIYEIVKGYFTLYGYIIHTR